MKTKKIFRYLQFFLILLTVAGCTNSCEKYSNGPEIEWLVGTRITYNYRSGVLAGFTAHIKFEVIDGTSGDIQISAEYDGEGKSCTAFVSPGPTYEAVVVCGISSTPRNSAVIVDSPTVAEPYKISTDVKTGVASIEIVEL
jgi:hypothetical protein